MTPSCRERTRSIRAAAVSAIVLARDRKNPRSKPLHQRVLSASGPRAMGDMGSATMRATCTASSSEPQATHGSSAHGAARRPGGGDPPRQRELAARALIVPRLSASERSSRISSNCSRRHRPHRRRGHRAQGETLGPWSSLLELLKPGRLAPPLKHRPPGRRRRASAYPRPRAVKLGHPGSAPSPARRRGAAGVGRRLHASRAADHRASATSRCSTRHGLRSGSPSCSCDLAERLRPHDQRRRLIDIDLTRGDRRLGGAQRRPSARAAKPGAEMVAASQGTRCAGCRRRTTAPKRPGSAGSDERERDSSPSSQSSR